MKMPNNFINRCISSYDYTNERYIICFHLVVMKVSRKSHKENKLEGTTLLTAKFYLKVANV